MGRIHYYDCDIAAAYGQPAAVLFSNLDYWIDQNEKNDRHFYEGRYWTYNSIKAFKEQFYYLGEKQIRNALNKLISEEIIMTGNFNASAYDRTLWYAFTDKGEALRPKRGSVSIDRCLSGDQIDPAERANGEMEITNAEISILPKGQMTFASKGAPIPYNKPNNKQTDIKPNNKEKEKKENLFSDFADQFSFVENTREDLISTLNDFVEARKQSNNKMNDLAITRLLNKLAKLAGSDGDKAIELLDESILNGWKSVFEHDNFKKPRKQSERRPAPLPDPSSDELADLTAKLAEMGYKFNEAKCEPEVFMLRQAIEYESSLNSYLADGYLIKI